MSDLDPVIHAQSRLRAMATLAAMGEGDQLTFPRLQQLLEMTAGNLSTHLRKLEEAGYVEQVKSHRGRTPVTHVGLTRRGRDAYDAYTRTLRDLLAPGVDTPTSTSTTAAGETR